MRTSCLALLIAVMLIGTGHAQDRETVRKMVFGHEAFLQDCVERQFDDTAAQMAAAGETPSEAFVEEVREAMRTICDQVYEGRNVCRDSDRAALVEKVIDFQAWASKKLLDPLMSADEYTAFESILKVYEWEERALRDPISHCT